MAKKGDKMTIEEVREIVSQISYEDYEFKVLDYSGMMLLQGRYVEPDIITKDPTDQHTRKWYISSHAVASEIVQTALLCVLTSAEHRVREHFFYKGKRVFGPHFDVEALHELAVNKRLDYRGKNNA